ncbi:MAG: hypothetical protein ACKPKO_60240, partial [Candidatus Fonsibacter sp.]
MADRWMNANEELSVRGTWERHVSKIEKRVQLLAARPGSARFRASTWNTYIVACVPFPAQMALPDL